MLDGSTGERNTPHAVPRRIEVAEEAAAIIARLGARTGLTQAEGPAEGVRVLDDGSAPGGEALERRLHGEVAAGYGACKADPDRAISGDEPMRRLHARSAQRRAVRPG